ncbi:hypothetical protein ACFW08_05815 [Streptomyces sp. NPDC058960]|uniref:hypothetical protein n=1 Tax=Streptomyces sp. NPDC058960 TaxID=3346679 RepID=UPI00367B74F4
MSPKEVARRAGDDVMHVDVSSLPTLQLEDIEGEEESALIARGAAYAREYAAIENKPTILAMNLATVLLAIRKQHDDWLGRTHEYRQLASEVYRQANIQDKAQLTRLQATVRYHVGNLLRRQLTPRELKRLELLDTSPLERQQDQRATNRALLAATKASVDVAASSPRKAAKKAAADEQATLVPSQERGPGLVVKATADHLRLASVAVNLVGQLDVDVIDGDMTTGQRAKLDEELAVLERSVRKLRRHLKTARSEG